MGFNKYLTDSGSALTFANFICMLFASVIQFCQVNRGVSYEKIRFVLFRTPISAHVRFLDGEAFRRDFIAAGSRASRYGSIGKGYG